MKARCAAALLVLASAFAAKADVPADSLKRLESAVARYEALAAKVKAESRLPQLSRPDEAPVLEALWDESLLGTPPYTQKDFEPLSKIAQAESEIMVGYLFFGGAQPSEAHVAKYITEILRAQAFTFEVSTDSLAAFVAQLKPEQMNQARKDGLKQVRRGIGQFVDGFTMELGADLPEKTKQIVTRSLAKNAAPMADALPPEERKAYVAKVQEAKPNVPDALKPDLETFVKAMSSPTCTGLCKVQ